MSYILEALKKAQAERQLGNAPTIHAPQPVQASVTAGNELAGSRKPLLLGAGAGVIVAVVGAALLWQRAPAPGVQVAQAPQTAAAPSGAASPAVAPAPASGAPSALSAPAASAGGVAATLAVRAPESPPAPPPAPRMAETRPAAPPSPLPGTAAGANGRSAAPAPLAPAPAATQAQAAPPAALAPEDSLPSMQQLPESIRSQIPRVSFGGYMYSANPADRLVLVDKGLRHEGEEVGPGLVLEKLLPHAAVMNFRGVRYRVAY
jgi:general secretion pathway protein B